MIYKFEACCEAKKQPDLKDQNDKVIKEMNEQAADASKKRVKKDDSVKGEIKAEKGTQKRKEWSKLKMIARKRPNRQPILIVMKNTENNGDCQMETVMKLVEFAYKSLRMGNNHIPAIERTVSSLPKNEYATNDVIYGLGVNEDESPCAKEELNQFVANDVWELVPQPRNMTIIGTKWVFRNKLDENGVVSRNKARLVAQGYNQQEGIDYDETYAPVARLESIRILLAYACALDFKLFQMDVKSAFLNGFINEEVYVAQPLGFIDFEKPDHVYKLKKALYVLNNTQSFVL
ncbi:retrovirus-related pol polyprotein from transposon TNT 1-94 [Tanacetum coccineum]